ncbi:lipopolysaccharide biosynthesis protein [Streptomyces sp. NPDC002521]
MTDRPHLPVRLLRPVLDRAERLLRPAFAHTARLLRSACTLAARLLRSTFVFVARQLRSACAFVVRLLRSLFAFLARLLMRWATVIPACALLGAAAGATYGEMKPPQYSATSYVIAVPAEKSRSDPAMALGFAQAYGRVATQLAVLGEAQQTARVPAAKLRRSVRAETSPDAPMIAITAVSRRPARAADIANAVSGELTKQANKTKKATGITLTRLSRALEPTEPSSASPALTTLVGACAGGLLGGLALLVRPRRATPGGDTGRAQLPGPAAAVDLAQEVR